MKPLIGEELENYSFVHTTPRPALFDELREETYRRMSSPQMQIGRVEGTLLKTLVAAMGARRVLEIGTFTGFSALCMAEGLPDDGELVTCDIDDEALGIARSFFERSPHGKKIRVAQGDALDTVRAMPRDGTFDLAFIDADKSRYLQYFETILPLLREGGLLVADNTLWSGAVLAPDSEDARSIAAFNERIVRDPRVEVVLLPVRDGVTLARKLKR